MQELTHLWGCVIQIGKLWQSYSQEFQDCKYPLAAVIMGVMDLSLNVVIHLESCGYVKRQNVLLLQFIIFCSQLTLTFLKRRKCIGNIILQLT